MRFNSRRTFLSLATVSAAGAIANHAGAKPVKKPQKGTPRLGIQLWSVRDDCARDMDGTLKWVARCGFEGVEFAGFHKYDKNPKGLRVILDQLGLKAEGSHVGAHSFGPDRLQQTIETYQTLGCRYLIVGADQRFTDPETSKAYADTMNAAAEALKPYGLYCGHHNHTEEFTPAGKLTYWDLFAQRTSHDVFLQLDVGWALTAGLDPVQLITRYPDRIKTLHIRGKHGSEPIIGKDNFAWSPILKAAKTVGGAEWFMLEQEEYPEGVSAMKSSELSFLGLKKILRST